MTPNTSPDSMALTDARSEGRRSLRALFEPRAVAVIDVSRHRGGVAEDILQAIRGIRLLRGFRDAAPRDEKALRTILLRVSALLEACPGVLELDLNPVIVTEDGAWAIDARVSVSATVQKDPAHCRKA